MNILSFKKKFIRFIASTSVFWKYRHIFDPKWFQVYANKKSDFYINLADKYKIYSILDFGCSSGSTLFNLKNKNDKLMVFGIDISFKAIKYSKKRFSKNFSSGFHFSNKLDKVELNKFLEDNNLDMFDLIIIDRVLFCISDREIKKILKVLTKHTKLIFIDDFYKDQKKSYSGGWKHRDWGKIFHEYGFELKFNNETIYDNVSDSNPRSMLFLRS